MDACSIALTILYVSVYFPLMSKLLCSSFTLSVTVNLQKVGRMLMHTHHDLYIYRIQIHMQVSTRWVKFNWQQHVFHEQDTWLFLNKCKYLIEICAMQHQSSYLHTLSDEIARLTLVFTAFSSKCMWTWSCLIQLLCVSLGRSYVYKFSVDLKISNMFTFMLT